LCEKEGCQDPAKCQQMRQKFLRINAMAIEKFGQHEYETLQKTFSDEGFGCINFSDHARKRTYIRAISETQIRTVITDGEVIEYHQNEYGTRKILLWGNIHLAKGQYRPIHIVLKKRKGETKWSIVTVYDPRSEAWRWNESFTERICFCE